MKSKTMKLTLYMMTVVLLLLLVLAGYIFYNEQALPGAYQRVLNEAGQIAQNEAGNVEYADKTLNDTTALGYFPVDNTGKQVEGLSDLVNTFMDNQIVKQSDHDVVSFYYKKTDRGNGYMSYDLYKDVYKYGFGNYKKDTSSLLATQYYYGGRNLTFEGLFESFSLEKDDILSALMSTINQVTNEKEKQLLQASLSVDTLKTLGYIYNPDGFSVLVKQEDGMLSPVALNIDALVPYFKEHLLLSDAHKSIYQSRIAGIKEKREKLIASRLDEIIATIRNNGATNKVALTFDDGPRADTTPRILDVLKQYDVKATFFILGQNIAGNENLLKREVQEGHELGNHTFTHRSLPTLTDDEVKEEIGKTQKMIEDITGVKPKSLRPPYGAYNQKVAELAKLPIALWNIDSEDWKSRNVNSIQHQVLDTTIGGSIILVHDIHEESAQSVESLILGLRERGFEFVTFSELYQDGQVLPNVVYFSHNDARKAD
ncbi:polysaccharide deacetylase family protein [Granulicatella sp. zg-ZJ]|uniref:polysaccharide deacetylase family protein n=1 Tax=Granulicatella sp. zg-ZJ TaxID=2678504 RepID=UPI0013D7D512|nr:polysaccharide deacetylase family protein [Granulicatella sp. zg-ZJ]NEW62335.1 polysaccharide deacetylase family protein [Granulicatella sp. zg-ZJ]